MPARRRGATRSSVAHRRRVGGDRRQQVIGNGEFLPETVSGDAAGDHFPFVAHGVGVFLQGEIPLVEDPGNPAGIDAGPVSDLAQDVVVGPLVRRRLRIC